ncbi:MAG: hypothetical protein ACLP1D_20740 [Xanthobacteraceae bacterium]
MTDIPDPVSLEWIARKLCEVHAHLGEVHAQMDGLSAGAGKLVEMLSRIEDTTIALHEEMRAFNEEHRRRTRPGG